MDLTIPVKNTTLNIRVAVLVQTDKGLILEKNKAGFFFVAGGRMKINETSEETAKREVFEELGVNLKSLRLRAIIENFFGSEGMRTHEICFVYVTGKISAIPLSEGFRAYTPSELNTLDIRPAIMKKIITSDENEILHLVARENTSERPRF